jgi:DNA-binding transcriptional LysR family regulator
MNNILHLKYAIEVERAGSISKAAETLYLSQPHLSKAIRELESSLGAAIFKRTSRGVIPTARGKEFLRRARVALRQLEGMEEIFKPSSHIRHALDLCVPPSCYLFEALDRYLQVLDPEKEVDLQFRHAHANGTMNRIADGEENLGILRYQSIYEPYYRKALHTFCYAPPEVLLRTWRREPIRSRPPVRWSFTETALSLCRPEARTMGTDR